MTVAKLRPSVQPRTSGVYDTINLDAFDLGGPKCSLSLCELNIRSC